MSDLTTTSLITELYKFIYSPDVEIVLRAALSDNEYEGFDHELIKDILAQLQIIAEEQAMQYRKAASESHEEV